MFQNKKERIKKMKKKIKIPKGIDEVHPLVMTEEYWANSQFSIARYYGGIQINKHEYWIVNKDGIDIYALSVQAAKEGRDKAIEAGEPCDLCLRELVPVYHWFGRDRMLELIKEGKLPSELITMYNNGEK